MVTPLTVCWRTTAVTRRARPTSRESEIGHGTPVGDGDRVELEVQLVAEIERHLLGALRLDHAHVLPEDDVLALLEDPVGLVEVVVLADEAIATAAIRSERLRVEEVEELLAAAPVHVADDRVGQVQLVARPAHGALAVLVGEHGVRLRAPRFGPLELVVE